MSEARHLIAVTLPAQEIAGLIARSTQMVVPNYLHPDNRGCDGFTSSEARYKPVELPFPDDVRFARAHYDPEVDAFILTYEHPSFRKVHPGNHVERVGVTSLAARVKELETYEDRLESQDWRDE